MNFLIGALIAGWANFLWAAPPTAAQMAAARASGLAWLFKNQQGNGSWISAPGLQTQATSAVIIAYRNAGIGAGRSYSSGVSFLAASQPQSVDGLARKMEALYYTGMDASTMDQALVKYQNAFGAWGTYKGFAVNIADSSLAVFADAVVTGTANNTTSAFCYILTSQQSGGGWSYQGAPFSSTGITSPAAIIPSAYAIKVIQGFTGFGSGIDCVPKGGSTTHYDFATVVAKGLTYLKNKQNADGGFGEGGVSAVFETELTISTIAYINASDSALDSARTYLIAQQNSINGSWGNDPFLTAMAVDSFPHIALANTAHDGVPDVVKQVLNLDVNTPSRGWVPSNGQAVTGSTAAAKLADATQWQAYATNMAGVGGTGPYTFALASGQLPEGLSLSSAGSITGRPTTAGPFEFTIAQTDSTGAVAYLIEQIQVAPSDPGGADSPTLPQWGAILMAALLLLTIATNEQRSRRK